MTISKDKLIKEGTIVIVLSLVLSIVDLRYAGLPFIIWVCVQPFLLLMRELR